MTIKEHFEKHKHIYTLSGFALAVIVVIILFITLFKKHDDTTERKYLDLYVATKDSLIAQKEKFNSYLQGEIIESKQTISYYKQKDSLTDVSIQKLLQKDRVLQKQQTDVADYINSLGHNADSIRRAFHQFD